MSPFGGGVGGGEPLTNIDYLSYMDESPSNLYHYNKRLRPLASQLRKQMTKAEACLWKYALRAGQMNGYEFRRQRPVLNYIADFMCKELMLIIEVDGLTHTWEEVLEKDAQREAALKNAGFAILRFSDNEVLTAMNRVKDNISFWIEEHGEKLQNRR